MSTDPRAAAVLAAARRHRAEAEAAERAKLEDAITWAALHEVAEDDYYATWGDTPIAITGEGAPLIAEMCIAEFAAALGLRTGAGRQFLADAVELAHRLPQVLTQVRAGRVQVFKARRIASRTSDLTLEGAAYVDRHVAFAAARVSLRQVELLVDEARAKFQPEEAAELARRAAESRHVFVDTFQVSFDGTSRVHAELDLADALDFDDAVNLIAKRLEQEPPELTTDACRAKAVGVLARGELVLPGEQAATTGTRARNLNLVVHLNSDGKALDDTVFLEQGRRLLVLDQIKDWAGDATRVTIRPVIDLHDRLSASGYAVPDAIVEHIELRDRHCVFPHCERVARACDKDHIEPYDPHGPPGQTNTDNLASLCRSHHRLKTFGGWSYQMTTPGVFRWRSPAGLDYLVDASGTRELTPQGTIDGFAPPGGPVTRAPGHT